MTTRPDWVVSRIPETVAIATTLKAMGYVTGQFGKIHLDDKNGNSRGPFMASTSGLFIGISSRRDERPKSGLNA
ncbi:hypothetical protein [Paraburkholderia hospita]|uniref:hypothetical protein n=1 Tax=Paraburkholderia hospita TaxID=169430 RepID=UPI000B345D94|nr:hypothetical protein CA603_43070 [Paraburkholderia hospita]